MKSYLEDQNLASIKIVATDMDLTLLHDDKSMPAGIAERIDALYERGILFCAASGRPAPALRLSFPNNHARMAMVCDNGANVYVNDNPIYKDKMDVELYQSVLTRVVESGEGVPVLCAYDEAYALARDYEHHSEVSIYYKAINYLESFEGLDVDANKVSVYYPTWNSKEQFDTIYQPEFGDKLYVTCAGAEWIDFMNIGIDKGSGMRRLAEHAGVDLADIAAFGDTYNDIPMLDIVGHSYVMGNAAETRRSRTPGAQQYMKRACDRPTASSRRSRLVGVGRAAEPVSAPALPGPRQPWQPGWTEPVPSLTPHPASA